MSLSPQALIRGVVSRVLPSANADSNNNDVAIRQLTYGEVATMPVVRKSHTLLDEGSYCIAHNNQTGLATAGASNNTFDSTKPFLMIYNGNTQGKSIYLDYIALTTTAAGAAAATSGTVINIAVVLDSVNRYSSGGTGITTINNAHMSFANPTGVTIYGGTVTATAATTTMRTLVGYRTIRPTATNAIYDVVGEQKILNFGGVEQAVSGAITVASVNIVPHPLPAVVLAPGQTMLLMIYYAGTTTTAASYAPEIGFWLR